MMLKCMVSSLPELLCGAQEGPAHVEAFMSVLRSVTKEDTVQYVLAVLDDMLTRALAPVAFVLLPLPQPAGSALPKLYLGCHRSAFALSILLLPLALLECNN